MKPFFLHIILLLCCLPGMGIAQTQITPASFYRELGMKDAVHELSLTHLDVDDERDFWMDQKRFEKLLQEKDPIGYQSYINGKFQVYREHQIVCGERCIHSEAFTRRMAFYLIHGESAGGTEVVLEVKAQKRN